MVRKCDLVIILAIITELCHVIVQGRGILVMYPPKDITLDCASSLSLRYDLSFGMGMSDTISVVLRTLRDFDYECQVDITSDHANKLIAVIRFPTTIGYNCENNPFAFHIMKYEDCIALCDRDELVFQDLVSKYWVTYTQGRFRFQFRSNSRVNRDINAFAYEVTVTTARLRGDNQTCYSLVNETECFAPLLNEYYCMTSGVVCDGIKNCGAPDWYDERKSDCEVPIQTIGYPPIFAVICLLMMATLALTHSLKRCLPRATNFFIFNSNQDNKFCIDPVFNKTGVGAFEMSEDFSRKKSLVPIEWSLSSGSEDDDDEEDDVKITHFEMSISSQFELQSRAPQGLSSKLMVMSHFTRKLQSVVGRFRASKATFADTSAADLRADQRMRRQSRRPTMVDRLRGSRAISEDLSVDLQPKQKKQSGRPSVVHK